jgi:hypothetical protein
MLAHFLWHTYTATEPPHVFAELAIALSKKCSYQAIAHEKSTALVQDAAAGYSLNVFPSTSSVHAA